MKSIFLQSYPDTPINFSGKGRRTVCVDLQLQCSAGRKFE